MAKTARYELRTDEEFIDRLTKVSIASGLTKPEAIGAGIDLLERLVEADRKGKEFALVDKGIVFQDLTTEPSTERLEFRTDPGFISLIQELADKDGVTRAEIVRRAIGLYAWAADEADKGHVLTPTPSTSNPTKTHKTEETYLAVAVAERVEQGKERVFTLEESLADLGL